jgi:hypothetical protein
MGSSQVRDKGKEPFKAEDQDRALLAQKQGEYYTRQSASFSKENTARHGNLSYPGGGGRRITRSRPAWAKVVRPYLKNKDWRHSTSGILVLA